MTKILVCDDEPYNIRLLQVVLERQGYEVVVATDGVECLEQASRERPDLIILDVVMPRMDGYTTLEVLKRGIETETIPVIMLSARAEDEDVLRGWKAGVECYAPKPFRPRDLIACIGRILATPEPPPAERRYELAGV